MLKESSGHGEISYLSAEHFLLSLQEGKHSHVSHTEGVMTSLLGQITGACDTSKLKTGGTTSHLIYI